MAQVTAAMVKELRQITDAPMMECKKALVEADGDIEKAIDVLRVNGLAKAVKKAGRDTNEGTIGSYVSEDGKIGTLIEVTCETDFVATNAKFKGFVNDLAKVVADCDPADVEALMACPMNGSTVDEALKESIFVIGENQKVVRFVRITVENGAIGCYVHHDGKHAESGRPEKFWEGIINGRLKKFFQERALTEQDFVKGGNETVGELAAKLSKELGDDIQIVSFVRFNFGE